MRCLLVVLTGLAALLAGLAHAEGCPLSGVEAQTWTQGIKGEPSRDNQTWYLGPCQRGQPGSQIPCNAGRSSWPTSGYLGTWYNTADGGDCVVMMHKQTQPWAATNSSAGHGYNATFKAPELWMHTAEVGDVTILCDATASNLEPVGDVVLTMLAHQIRKWSVTLKSNAVCGTAPSGPTLAPTSSGCGQYTTCQGCTEAAGPAGGAGANCGFCPGSKTCMAGTSAGPSSGVCKKWEWYLSQCSKDE